MEPLAAELLAADLATVELLAADPSIENVVTIVVDAVPDDASASFPFVGQTGSTVLPPFALTDPTSPSIDFAVNQGELDHFLQENFNNPPYWGFPTITCDVPTNDPQVSWDQPSGLPEVNVTIAAGDLRHVTCTFTIQKLPEPAHIVVNPATVTNRAGDDDKYQIELRVDSDNDGRLDSAVIGAAVSLSWTGPAGSGIELVNGAPPTGSPTNSATCTTVSPIFPYLDGLCFVQINSPGDAGSGSLTASYSVPNAGAGAPDLPPSGNATTNCTAPTTIGDVITVCNAVQDAQRIEASA